MQDNVQEKTTMDLWAFYFIFLPTKIGSLSGSEIHHPDQGLFLKRVCSGGEVSEIGVLTRQPRQPKSNEDHRLVVSLFLEVTTMFIICLLLV